MSQNRTTRKNTSRMTASAMHSAAAAASTAIRASRVLSSSISLAKISMRVCTSATKVLARFLSESNKPSARPLSSVMARLSGG